MKFSHPKHQRKTNIVSAFFGLTLFFGGIFPIFSQSTLSGSPAPMFKIGERISYDISFENIKDVAKFETAVLSQGKIGEKAVVEIRGRLKTFEIVSAAFSFVDEERTVYADPVTGLPVSMTRSFYDGVLPKEVTSNFIDAPPPGFDLLTALFAIRNGAQNGSVPIFENGESSVLTLRSGKNQRIKTDAGEFEALVTLVSGPFLDSRGIKAFTIFLSNDDARLPVLIQIKTARGTYRAEAASVRTELPTPTATPKPDPTPSVKPTVAPTPKPIVTPTPFVENEPLLPELAFKLGEVLEYRISTEGKNTALLRLTASDRKLYSKREGLKLSATITGIEQGNWTFVLGDSITTIVDPEMLSPIQSEMKFGGELKRLNQTSLFDLRTGAISFGAAQSVDAPIGTHSLLSLIYALRSFNLRPSKDPGNPVNDTRVSVFWAGKTNIFIIRPFPLESITFNSDKIQAQPLTIRTGNPELDALNIKIWLSSDARRVPIRFSLGAFQADLISISNSLVK